jgi:hypothetical protein
MDCRFCCVRPATLLGLPTTFGPADLCEVCADRYQRYLRRRRPRRGPPPGNETGGPATAARFCDSSPSTSQSQEATACPNPV